MPNSALELTAFLARIINATIASCSIATSFEDMAIKAIRVGSLIAAEKVAWGSVGFALGWDTCLQCIRTQVTNMCNGSVRL